MVKLNIQIVFTLILLLLLANSCSGQEQKTKQQKEFEQYLKQICVDYEIPAIAAALVKKDKIEKIAAVGVKKLGGTDSVDIYNKFHLGSCGKSFTGMLAQKLVDEQLIAWDDKPLDVFPQFKGKVHEELVDITFLDLMTHRAGIPSYMYWHQKEQIPEFEGSEAEKREQTSLWQLKQAPGFEIGEYQYSNIGYVIAAAMMEKKTGKAWEELVKDYVFDPMSIESFGYGRPALNDKTQPYGHWIRMLNQTEHELVEPDEYALNSIERPAGDVHLSLVDFARYVQDHLRGLQGKKATYSKEFYESVHNIRDQYALGWSENNRYGEKCSMHYGSDATFFAVMVVFHEVDVAIAIVANSATPLAKQGVNKVLYELY